MKATVMAIHCSGCRCCEAVPAAPAGASWSPTLWQLRWFQPCLAPRRRTHVAATAKAVGTHVAATASAVPQPPP